MKSFFIYLNNIFQNPGFSIIFISFLIQLLFLPLSSYINKKKLSFNIVTKKIKNQLAMLNKKYNGGELNEKIFNLYKTNGSNYIYKNIEIILLFIQIPILLLMYFFIIDNLVIFNHKFFFLSNLSLPDQSINLSSLFGTDFYINILPLLLLILYILDGIKNNKLFSLPMLFSIILIILIYGFPSALLLFWICFYFFKILFEFLKNSFEIFN